MAKKSNSGNHSWNKYHTAQRIKWVIDELDSQRKSQGGRKFVLDGINITSTWLKECGERLDAAYEALEGCNEDCALHVVHYGVGVRVTLQGFKPNEKGNIEVSYSLVFPTTYHNSLCENLGIKDGKCVRGKSSVLLALENSYDPAIEPVEVLQKNDTSKSRFGVLYKDRCIWPWEIGNIRYDPNGVDYKTPMHIQWPPYKSQAEFAELLGNGEFVSLGYDVDGEAVMLDIRQLEIGDIMRLECCYRNGDKDFVLSDSDFDALRMAMNVHEEAIAEEQDSAGTADDADSNGKILSLAKARTKTDITKFLKKFSDKYETTTFIVSPKMDGCALRLFYDGTTGDLVGAITKGKGRNVVDIANLLAAKKIIPQKLRLLNHMGEESIGWEVDPRLKHMITNNDYELIEITGELCASDRKDIAGLLQRKSATAEDIPSGTKFFAYDSETLSTPSKSKHRNSSSLGWRASMIAYYDDLIATLGRWDFDTVYITRVGMSDIRNVVREGINTGCLLYTDTKTYPIDGVVIRVNSNDRFHREGKTSHHPNGAIALKYEETWEPVIVKSVDTSIGVNNVHKVVIGFDTRTIGTRFVRSATAQFVGAHNVKAGDEVLVCLRGCVIPVWKFKD